MGVLRSCVFVAVCFLQVIPCCSRSIPITGITDEDQTEKDGSQFNQRLKREHCPGPPFNVACHGYCPPPTSSGWNELVMDHDHNCSNKYEGSRFHCAMNTSGVYIVACAKPVACNKGMEPIIKFPHGHTKLAEISCDWCRSNRFNPEEGKQSNTYSYCQKRRQECPSSEGQIECDIVTGFERHWTDSKCRCNIRKNYLPLLKNVNNCTDGYSVHCSEKHPCPDTDDGRKQEYLSSNYSCAPVCDIGFHPRDLDTDDCIPIENKVTAVYENATFTTTTTVVSSTSTTTTPPTPSTRPTSENGNGSFTCEIAGIVIGALVVVTYLVVGIICVCCIRKHEWNDTNEKSGCVVVLAVLVGIICWCCYLIKGHQNNSNNEAASSHETIALVSDPRGHQNNPNNEAASSPETVALVSDPRGHQNNPNNEAASSPETVALVSDPRGHQNNPNNEAASSPETVALVSDPRGHQNNPNNEAASSPETVALVSDPRGHQNNPNNEAASSPETVALVSDPRGHQNNPNNEAASSPETVALVSDPRDESFNKFKEKIPEHVRSKRLGDRQTNKLAHHFGNNWNLFMMDFGLTEANIDQINADNLSTVGRVAAALRYISAHKCTLTLDKLHDTSRNIRTTIVWQKITELAEDETFWDQAENEIEIHD